MRPAPTPPTPAHSHATFLCSEQRMKSTVPLIMSTAAHHGEMLCEICVSIKVALDCGPDT
eukprot:7380237-Prymnesium_polylepis.2